jgi:hypothetical protein
LEEAMTTNRKLLSLLGAATLTVVLAGGAQAAADASVGYAASAPWLAPTKVVERERVVRTPPRYPTGDEQECQGLGC